MHFLKSAACLASLSFLSIAAPAATYQVASIAELTSRVSAAAPGDIIIVQNGVYTTTAAIGINRVGIAANPILIRAETVGGVEINGSNGFSLSSPAAYVTIQGFKFTHAAAINISSGTSHCRFARNLIQLAIPAGSDVSYINISGDDVEIDRNELRNKSTLGEMLDVTGSGSQVARRLWVHHNYFHDFTSPGGNGAETIRLGLSGLSLSTGNAIVEYNLFIRCEGENEMISNKSSGNTYRYNTVIDCVGGEISQRHGNDCLYYGNYMRNTQGIRVYGDRHKIFSNYLEGNSVGVNMGNGDGDVYNGAPLTSHDRPDDNIVVFNTFINNGTHYEMGGRTGGLGSSNTVVANNIFQGGGSMASISSTAPYTGTWSGNIRWQTSSAGNMPASGYTTVNPLLALDATGIFHLQPGSPAINAALGSYPFVTLDMDGQPRDGAPDKGADEFSAAPVLARLLTPGDVGPASVAPTFNLAAAPASRSVPPSAFTNATYTVTVTDLFGSNAPVTLFVWGLPSNTVAAFVPPSVMGSGSSTLNLTISNSAPAGIYTLVITGVSTNSTNFASTALFITRPPTNLRWAPTSSSLWDVNVTANWLNLGNSTTDTFIQGDSVLFDDTGNQTNISLNVAVSPSVLTNDSNTLNYTLSGSGSISGSASLVKNGTSTLTLATANDFSGTVTVLGGTLRAGIGGALGSGAGATIVNGGTLDINAINLTGEPVTAAGDGPAAQGALVNNGAQQTSALRNLTLGGDTTFGGTGRWDIRAASSGSTNGCSLVTSGQPYKLTKVGTNQVSLVAVSVDAALGDIDVKEGVFGIQTVTSQLGNPARAVTVFPNATLNLWNLNAAPLNKRLAFSNNATLWNENGNSIVAGPVELRNGVAIFKIEGASLTISNNVISGPGGLTKTGPGTLTLRGANSFTGPTQVSTGTLALVDSGSIAGSPSIAIDFGATLDVAGRADGTLTIADGQTLGGNGTVNGSLNAASGAVVSPGASIGSLTVTNAVVLRGVTFMEFDKSANTNDVLVAASIDFGGTLSLTNLGGTLVAGDSFALFNATSYSGAFTSIVPPMAGPGLAWDTSTLLTDGSLRVAIAPRPVIASVAIDGNNLVLSGTNGVRHADFYLLATTDLALPLAQWTVVATNTFGSTGGFSITTPLADPQRYFLLRLP